MATMMVRVAAGAPLAGGNLSLVDDLSRRAFLYFHEQTDPRTGLTLDRVPASGIGPPNGIASIADSGFALAAFCIGQEHHWISRASAEQSAVRTLTFFVRKAPRKNGWFYHFMQAKTGERSANSEISSIDTAFLLAGALTARACFQDDPEIVSLASELFDEVDFPWMMNRSKVHFSQGWTPENGFMNAEWSSYSELLILYVLGIGSLKHPISATTWEQWSISMESVGGYTYIGGGPLFIHQYPLAFLDLRYRFGQESGFHANYLLNSILATRAQRQGFQEKLAGRFHGYSEDVWGLTSSDSPMGYIDWGDSLSDTRIDGTVAPSAVAGSLMFTPDICIPALRRMLELYGKKAYGRYGFVDAFNPTDGWVSRDVVGIDAGITLLSAENLRTGSVWRWFMSNPEPERALDLVGLVDRRHPWKNYRIDPDYP